MLHLSQFPITRLMLGGEIYFSSLKVTFMNRYVFILEDECKYVYYGTIFTSWTCVWVSAAENANMIFMASPDESLMVADHGLSHARMKSKTKSLSEPVSHFLFVALSGLHNSFTHRCQVNHSERQYYTFLQMKGLGTDWVQGVTVC